MITQGIGETKKTLHGICEAPEVPVMIWGPPGVGKTAAVRQVADEMGLPVWGLRLSLMDIVDFRGVPVPDMVRRVTEWLRPGFLPGPGDPAEGILFLDEVNTAMPAIQALAYQLIQEGRVGEHVLPVGWRRWAAGNNLEDKGVAYRMPAPLANRMVHLEVKPDFEDWRTWALNADVHPLVIAYLTWAPKSDKDGGLSPFWVPPRSVEAKAFPTPRSWEMVSRIIRAFKEDLEAAAPAIGGAIGWGYATEFLAFARNQKDLPPAEEILAGKEYPAPQRADLIMITIATLVASLRKNALPHRISNFVNYVVNFPSTEYHVIAFKDADRAGIKIEKLLIHAPAFKAWAGKNASLIL